MIDSLLFEWCGWAGFIMILIPLVLLVRLLVKRSRWSILRMTIVALTGVAIVSLWLHYADTIIVCEPMTLSGKLGLWYKRRCHFGSILILVPYSLSYAPISFYLVRLSSQRRAYSALLLVGATKGKCFYIHPGSSSQVTNNHFSWGHYANN